MKRIGMERGNKPNELKNQEELSLVKKKSPLRLKKLTSYLKKLVSITTIHTLCFLLITTTPVQAQGQVMQAIGAAVNIVNQGMQQAIQQQQAAIAAAQLQQQMQSLQPQPVPSKYHPHCQVSKAVTDFPEGACSNGAASEQELQQVMAFRELAVSYRSFYNNLTAESQNSPQPVGLQCIEEANKNVDTQMQDKLNALEAMIAQVKKETQAFEQEQQKIKEEMDKTKAILYGGSNNVEVQNTDFIKEFSPSCQVFYKTSGLVTVRQKGFAGLRDDSEVFKNQAGTFRNNKDAYVTDLKNQLQTVRDQIAKDGLSVVNPETIENLLQINGRTFQFGSANAIIQANITNFTRDFEIISRDLNAVGFRVTQDDLNGDFNERMSRFAQGASRFFKKEAIAQCVNGEGATGIGLNTDQILNGLKHRTASGSSTALESYRTALRNILNSDAFIEDKMESIRILDQRYGVGNIYLDIQGADAITRESTAYNLYKQQIEICEARINQDDTFSTVDNLRKSGGSVAERIADAERALQKAINLEREFSTNLTESIFDRVVNCDGLQKSEDQCMPGQNGVSLPALDTSNQNFCIGHAQSCADQASACYAETDVIVQKNQQQMKTLAATYNARVSNLIARQEFFLNQIKAQVVNDAEFIKRYIPGAAYTFPQDLFVKMPQQNMDDAYGVVIAGDINDISALTEDLPEQLNKFKELLSEQRRALGQELDEYLNKQRAGMEADRGKWETLQQTCDAAIDGYRQMMEQVNQQQGESFAESQNFCQKFDALAQNPAAGCGQADSLFEDSLNAAAGLQNANATRRAALEYQNFCNSVQNESERGSGDDDDDNSDPDFELLAAECASSSSEEVLETMREDIIAAIPSSYSDEERQAIRSFLNGTASRGIAAIESRSLRRDPFVVNYVRPFDRMREPSGELSLTLDGEHDIGGRRATLTSQITSVGGLDEANFCEVYNLERNINAFNNCKGDNATESCFEDKQREARESNISAVESAAQLIAQQFEEEVASESGRIGEIMRGTPCMAQQGANGSQGFDLNAFDQSILGAAGAGVLNSLAQ